MGRVARWISKHPWLFGILLIGAVVVVLIASSVDTRSNPLYDRLMLIAVNTNLPPSGAERFWYKADVTAEVCPFVDRASLAQMAKDVPSRVFPERPDNGFSPGKDDWTIFSPGTLMSCFDRSLFRAIGISLDEKTNECEATASIVPSCFL